MRVFLSWSGDDSRQVALVLKDWLPTVVQALDPWVSSSDIEKGEAWFAAIENSLVRAEGVGIFCLTPNNLDAPWLAYEAGALAAQDRSRVATFLHNVQPSSVRPPLGLFQATIASNKDDVYRLVSTLNARLASPLSETRLSKAFEPHWLALEQQLSSIRTEKKAEKRSNVSSEELLHEILSVVRRIEKDGLIRGVPDALFVNSFSEDGGATNLVGQGGLLAAALEKRGTNKLADMFLKGAEPTLERHAQEILRRERLDQLEKTRAFVRAPRATSEKPLVGKVPQNQPRKEASDDSAPG